MKDNAEGSSSGYNRNTDLQEIMKSAGKYLHKWKDQLLISLKENFKIKKIMYGEFYYRYKCKIYNNYSIKVGIEKWNVSIIKFL